MKEVYFFRHDYHARDDLKMRPLTMEQIGIFWCLVEMLYEEGGYIELNLCERIANALRTQATIIQHLIDDSDLFQKDDKKFWSNTVLRRLEERYEKSEKARNSAKKLWEKIKNKNANASERKRTLAIKERKRKEIYTSVFSEKNANNKKSMYEEPTIDADTGELIPPKSSTFGKYTREVADYYSSTRGKLTTRQIMAHAKEVLEHAQKQYPDDDNASLAKEVKIAIDRTEEFYKKRNVTEWGLRKVIENWDLI